MRIASLDCDSNFSALTVPFFLRISGEQRTYHSIYQAGIRRYKSPEVEPDIGGYGYGRASRQLLLSVSHEPPGQLLPHFHSGHLSVDLGRADVGVAPHVLNVPYVGTPLS